MHIRIGRREHSLKILYQRFFLGVFFSTLVYVVFIKLFPQRRGQHIILYGHNLNGNLLALAEYLHAHTQRPVYFMTDDPEHYHKLKNTPSPLVSYLSSQNFFHLAKAASAAAIISSHGPIFLHRWQHARRSKRPIMADTWHGIGFKGNVSKAISKMKGYDLHFVPSATAAQFYRDAGIADERIKITGFGRTDALVGLTLTPSERHTILRSYDLDPSENRTIVLYAPTWNEKDQHSIFPFGTSKDETFSMLSQVAQAHNALILFRPHLNSQWTISGEYAANLKIISASLYPVAEKLLQITDVLVTDWSSIFAEYMALKKPMIFIDTPPSFGDYIAPLTVDDRPGAIVNSIDSFKSALIAAITDPIAYNKSHSKQITATTEHAWGTSLDGKSTKRYWHELSLLIEGK